MTDLLPDPDRLYQALVDRDARFDGLAFACVTTTGIFCRPSCPARKPLRANCQFRATPEACLAAGFRPCKRCHPMGDQIRSPRAGRSPTVASNP